MKKKFSRKWIASSQPRKQRKYLANAPLHTKHKFLNANLSKPLREKYGKRNLPLKKGDEVLVMRGASKNKKAKVASVILKRSKITLENIQRTKRDGTKVSIFFSPSSLQIQTLNLEDQKRLNSLQRGSKIKPVKKESKSEESKTESKPKENGTPKKTKNNN